MTDDPKPRAMTAEECRTALFAHIAATCKYWETIDLPVSRRDSSEINYRLTGFLHSILVIFDGGTVLPAFDISPSPHPDDEEFHRSEGDNWWPTGVVINDVALHETFPWETVR